VEGYLMMESRVWKAVNDGTSVIFVCKICGYTVRANVKNYDLAYVRMLEHIAERHACI
jgi:flavin reductase (DIM6/NTAB) family NADH-FMN oxidoreductase RutF